MSRYVATQTVQSGGGATPADVARARDIRNRAAEAGKDVSIADATRTAVAERLNGAGGLGSAAYGKDVKPPKDEKSLANVQLPQAPKSTEWDPRRNIQGTDAYKAGVDQDNYNFSVATVLKRAMGERVDPHTLLELGKGFAVQRGDSQETIDMKRRSLGDFVARQVAGEKPGGAPAATTEDFGFTPEK